MNNRELNILIAEKVMGWKYRTTRNPFDYSGKDKTIYDVVDVKRVGVYTETRSLPEFSTDITAAWQVIEKMKKSGWHISIQLTGRDWDVWYAGKGISQDDTRTWDGSAPKAICLATLKAVRILVRNLMKEKK